MVPDGDVPEEEAEGVPAVEGQVDALHAQLIPGVAVGGEPETPEVRGRPQLVVEDPGPQRVGLTVVVHLRGLRDRPQDPVVPLPLMAAALLSLSSSAWGAI